MARATIVPGSPARSILCAQATAWWSGNSIVSADRFRIYCRSSPALRDRNVAFRSLTEQMDTTTPHGEFLFGVFGALAQFERALTQERVRPGLAAARRRGRRGGRPPAIGADKLEAVITALDAGTSKAAVCRSFGVARSTLIDTLARAGWTGPGSIS